jgi:hypothetical protein
VRGKPQPPTKRTTPKISVRHVKFTPEEMAYEAPEDTSDWIPVPGRGWAAYEKFRQWKRQMAKLDPEVRKAFPDDRSVNEVLRKVMEIRGIKVERRKRSA